MVKKILSHADIISAEAANTALFRQELEKWGRRFEELVDLLMRITALLGEEKPVQGNNPKEWFFAFTRKKYLEAPSSIRVCMSLIEKGYYAHAMIQLRTFLDGFVACRYFHHEPQQVIPYLRKDRCVIEGKKVWLAPTHIYGYFSRDFFDRFYGDMLTGLSVGKVDLEIQPIPAFNLKQAFSIINYLLPIIYGYLVNIQEFFGIRLPPDLDKECKEAIAWLKEQPKKQADRSAVSQEWLEGIRLLIGI